MRLAISTYSLSAWQRTENISLYKIVDWVAEHARGIEFSGVSNQLGKNPLKEAEKLRNYCEKKGLQIAGYCCGAELFQLTKTKLNEQINMVKREIDIAAKLGVKNMRHDVTRGFPKTWRGSRSFSVVLRHVVPPIRELADYASQYNIKTSLENHGFYMQKSERIQKLIEAVNYPNFGLTLDLGNFLCVNEEPKAAVKRLIKYAIHIHIKDFHIKPKRIAPPAEQGWLYTPSSIAIRGAILGHGNVDLEGCMKIIKRAGYKGWLSLEFEGLEEPRRGVEFGLAYAKKLLDKK